jgi:two-component system sensor histidine kinase UhpB
MLDDLGLIVALEWHFKRYFKQTGIRVQFQHSPLPNRLPAQLETVVFRIVQEALTNAARHAGVKSVNVRLQVTEDSVRVQVEDRGRGFVPAEALRRGASTGLTGMKERAELLGGKLALESAPGQGTRLTVDLPMSQPPSRRTWSRWKPDRGYDYHRVGGRSSSGSAGIQTRARSAE